MEFSQEGRAAKVVYLHVGAPKTGTTYLQDVLWHNRDALGAAGICYPLEHHFEHFGATMDLRETTWGGGFRDPAWNGAWDRIAARVRDWEGPTAVVSNELLGAATPTQAARAVSSMQPAEVHVVFTARDLARQLPSDWQEQIKHNHKVTLGQFVGDLVRLGIAAPEPFGEMFWGLHDPVRVLRTWTEAVPADRIHVVTVPQRGSQAPSLWERYAGLLGADPTAYTTEVPGGNASLGAPETEVLRRLNVALKNRLAHHYDPLARMRLAENTLSSRRSGVRTTLPAEHFDWVAHRSRELIDGIKEAGYQVVGDLEELMPVPTDGERSPDPDALATSDLADVASFAVAGLLNHLKQLEARASEREREVEDARQERAAQQEESTPTNAASEESYA